MVVEEWLVLGPVSPPVDDPAPPVPEEPGWGGARSTRWITFPSTSEGQLKMGGKNSHSLLHLKWFSYKPL